MSASQHPFRNRPLKAIEPIDPARIPDCGAGAIARLRGEAARFERRLWFLATALWLSLCVFLLGVATLGRAPWILLGGFFVAQETLLMVCRGKRRMRLNAQAVEEILRLQGEDRVAAETRLRAEVEAWNDEAGRLDAERRKVEWMTDAERALIQEAYRLGDAKLSLLAAIARLRGDAHGAP